MDLKNYLIVKYKNDYKIYDVLEFKTHTELNYKFHITRDNKVYLGYDDYFFIGEHIGINTYVLGNTIAMKKKKDKDYIGKLIYSTNNIEKCFDKYAELKGYKHVD